MSDSNKKVLSEENYEKSKKKIQKIALIILVLGCIIGGMLIIMGAVGINQVNSSLKQAQESQKQEKERQEQLIESQKQADATKKAEESTQNAKRIEEINAEISKLESDKDAKDKECDSLNMSDPNWYANENACKKEVQKIDEQIIKLEQEKNTLGNTSTDDFDTNFDKFSEINKKTDDVFSKVDYHISSSSQNMDNYWMIDIGIFVIIVSFIIALFLYFLSKMREIQAYNVQSSMPIAKEGIEEMTTTVSNAAGEVAKSVSKGIKDGLSDDNKEKSDK